VYSFPALLPVSCAREALGQGPGFSPAGLAGAEGVLDVGDRAPMIGAAGKGSRGGWVRLSFAHSSHRSITSTL
jgi:hypothetical protein